MWGLRVEITIVCIVFYRPESDDVSKICLRRVKLIQIPCFPTHPQHYAEKNGSLIFLIKLLKRIIYPLSIFSSSTSCRDEWINWKNWTTTKKKKKASLCDNTLPITESAFNMWDQYWGRGEKSRCSNYGGALDYISCWMRKQTTNFWLFLLLNSFARLSFKVYQRPISWPMTTFSQVPVNSCSFPQKLASVRGWNNSNIMLIGSLPFTQQILRQILILFAETFKILS